MKKIISLLLSGTMLLSLCGCSEAQTETLDNTLKFVGDTWNSAVDAATGGINYLGQTLNLNGEYATTTEALQAYADEFMNSVTAKLETIDPQYVDILNEQMQNLDGIKEQLGTATEEISYSETTSSTYFAAFDDMHYDIEYTTYVEGKGFVLNHIVKDGEAVYCNAYDFNLEGKEAFELFGLTFKAYEDGTWYDCNQLLKQKTQATEPPTGYSNFEYILDMITPGNFYSSTINNLISIADGVTVDSFKQGTTELMVVYTDGNLSAMIVMENGEITGTLLVQSFKLILDTESTELVSAVSDYTLSA